MERGRGPRLVSPAISAYLNELLDARVRRHTCVYISHKTQVPSAKITALLPLLLSITIIIANPTERFSRDSAGPAYQLYCP